MEMGRMNYIHTSKRKSIWLFAWKSIHISICRHQRESFWQHFVPIICLSTYNCVDPYFFLLVKAPFKDHTKWCNWAFHPLLLRLGEYPRCLGQDYSSALSRLPWPCIWETTNGSHVFSHPESIPCTNQVVPNILCNIFEDAHWIEEMINI